MNGVITRDSLQAVIDSHEWQWRQRLMEYILPRLNCSQDEKVTLFDMIWAAIDQGQDEGIANAIDLVSRLKIGAPEARDARIISIVEDSLVELRKRNAQTADEILSDKEG